MNNDPQSLQAHPDELLPWLVNHTLSDQEQRLVEAHVETCTRCQQEVELLRRTRTQVKEFPLQSPGKFGLNRLMKEIQQENERIRLARPSPWRKSLVIAASFIIILQAGLLLDAWFLSPPMTPLSGPKEGGTILQISFVPDTTEDQIRQSLNAVNAIVIDGPGPLGIYRIRLESSSTDHAAVEQTIEQLRRQPTIFSHVAQD